MLGFKVLKLKTEEDKNFFYNKIAINKLKREIEELLSSNPQEYMDTFRNLVMTTDYDKEGNNLANGYFYILKQRVINKDTVKKLYSIISKDLEDDYSKRNSGDYYRTQDVFILDYESYNLIGYFDKGVDPKQISDKMDDLFEYINEKPSSTDEVDRYIKSQIIHYYFAYVHPYYDFNGRTARELSTWYLLNNGAEQCTVFNRGIESSRLEYKQAIKDSRSGNLTPFLKYSLNVLKEELKTKGHEKTKS